MARRSVGPAAAVPTGLITKGELDAAVSSAVGPEAFIATKYANDRADEVDAARRAEALGKQIEAYLGDELQERWESLAAWKTAGTVSVDGSNRLEGGASGRVLRSFPINWDAGETAHIVGTFSHPTGGSVTGLAMFLALDFGTADHVPGTGDAYMGVGINAVGNRTSFVSGMGSVDFKYPVIPPLSTEGPGTIGGTPTGATDYVISADIGPETVSFSMIDTKLGDSQHGQVVLVVDRADLPVSGKTYVNILLSVASSTSNHPKVSPVAAVKGLNTSHSADLRALDQVVGRWVVPKYTTNEKWMYQLPQGYDPMVGAPLFLFCHQSETGDWDELWDEADVTKNKVLRESLLAAGYIIASCQDGGDRWGNQASLDNYTAFYQYISRWHNVSYVVLGASSMGTSAALNLINHNTFPTPVALAAVGAMINMRFVWDHFISTEGGSIETSFKAAYGMASDGEFDAKTVGYRMEDYPGWAYRGVPMKFWISESDQIVESTSAPLANATAFANKIAPFTKQPVADGSTKTIVRTGLTGPHGSVNSYQGAEIVAFLEAYRRPSRTAPLAAAIKKVASLVDSQPVVAPAGTVNPATLADDRLLFEYPV
jgi:hypothetical protein